MFLLLLFRSSAQLTNAEVYNFQIGDVLETKLSSPNNLGYILDTIVGKSTGVDSITYIINRIQVEVGPNPSGFAITDTLVITNLNSPPNHYYYFSCLPPIDDSLVGNCNERVDRRTSAFDTNCFEPPYWTSTLHEGLGGPYYVVYDPSNLVDISVELNYSNTALWGVCGNYYDPTIGINELKADNYKTLIHVFDIMGRETEDKPNTLLIYIYSDGTTEKVFRVE